MAEQLPELATSLTIAGFSGALLRRVLGPPADAIGRRLAKSIDEFHAQRLVEVFRNAADKTTDEAGEINSRVLGKVVHESEWIDDRLTVEYLGGVLASAKTPEGRDDRGVSWTAMVGRLSTYQLRMHYLLYTVARQLFPGRVEGVADGDKLKKGTFYLPASSLESSMDFSDVEKPAEIVAHCLFGLHEHGLIGEDFCSGRPDFLKERLGIQVVEGGLVCSPTALGVELYLWAHGKGSRSLESFLDPSEIFEYPPEIVIPEGARLVSDLTAINVAHGETGEAQGPPEVEPQAQS